MGNNNNIEQTQKALKAQEALGLLLFKLIYNSMIVGLLCLLANLFIEIGYFQTYLFYLLGHLIYNVTQTIKRRWK